jgi:hypothetical protein
MPRVEIPGVGIVQFPDNMPQDQIMARAEAMQNQAKQPLLDPRELGIGQLIGGGFSRGIESLKGTAFDLIRSLSKEPEKIKFGTDNIKVELINSGAQANALGTATANAAAVVTVTGLQAVGSIGDVSVAGKAVIDVTGLVGTTFVGTATVAANSTASVTGVQATGFIGNVNVSGKALVTVTGVSATGIVAQVLVWGLIDDNQNPNWVQITTTESPTWANITTSENPTWVEIPS